MASSSTLPHNHPSSPAYRRRWWTLAVLALSLVIIGLDNTILNVALPTLQQEFQATSSQLQWMVDSYIVVFAGLLLTLGALGDRYGRAKALQIGLIIFAGASLWAAYADSVNALIFARAIMGIGGALIMPATLSVLIDVFPREERGRAIAIWSAVAGLGIGLGPVVAGLLLERFWWGSIFLINVPIAIVALIVGWWLVPDSRDPHHPRPDITGSILSISAISLLVYSIIEAPNHGWTSTFTIGLFTGSAILIGLFGWWESRISEPMLDFSLFRDRRFSLGAGAIGITFFTLFGTVFVFTQYLQFVKGYSPLEAGIRLLPLALGIAIGAGRSDHLVQRFGTTRVVAGAMMLLTLTLASFATLDSHTSYWVIGIIIFLVALGMGNVMSPATAAVMGAVPEAKAGVGSAMNDLVRQVAGALGVAIIGSIMNTVYADRMTPVTGELPQPFSDMARDSLGTALRIATEIGGEPGLALASVARTSFLDAMGIAALAASTVALIGVFVVARWLPARSTSLATPTPERQPDRPIVPGTPAQ